MPDDPHIARIEERVEQLVKRLDRHELAMERAIEAIERTTSKQFEAIQLGNKEQFRSLEKLLREAITSGLAAQDAKNAAEAAAERTQNALVRLVVYAACGAILLFFLNAMLSGSAPRLLPEKAPAHSSQESRQ